MARAGKPAYIHIKVNNLCDNLTAKLLSKAANSGVEVKLIIRGMCSLQTQTPHISDKIQVHSIVDRFLEHARVMIFGNDGSPFARKRRRHRFSQRCVSIDNHSGVFHPSKLLSPNELRGPPVCPGPIADKLGSRTGIRRCSTYRRCWLLSLRIRLTMPHALQCPHCNGACPGAGRSARDPDHRCTDLRWNRPGLSRRP